MMCTVASRMLKVTIGEPIGMEDLYSLSLESTLESVYLYIYVSEQSIVAEPYHIVTHHIVNSKKTAKYCNIRSYCCLVGFFNFQNSLV